MVHAIFVMKESPNICYSTQLKIPWKQSLIHFQQYQPTPITIPIGIECHKTDLA